MTTPATIVRTPSVDFFDRLRGTAENPSTSQAQAALEPMFMDYFADAPEPVLLQKAARLLDIACTLAPGAPLEKKPVAVLVEQLGGVCIGVEQLAEQATVASNVVATMVPIVLQRSERARLSQAAVVQFNFSDLMNSTLMGVMSGLQNLAPQFEVDQARLQVRLKAAMDACYLSETLMLAHASRLSVNCLTVLGQRVEKDARYIRTITTQFMPKLVGQISALIEAAENNVPVPTLTAEQEDLRKKLLELAQMTANEAFIKHLSEPDQTAKADEPPDPFNGHLRELFLRTWSELDLEDQMVEQLAFYKTPEGQEYLQHKQAIDASGNSELRKAQIGRALEPVLEEASAKRAATRTHEMQALSNMFDEMLRPLADMSDENKAVFLQTFTETFDALSQSQDD